EKGDAGERGEKGEKGDDGLDGAAGPAGADGLDGESCTVENLPDGQGGRISCPDGDAEVHGGEKPNPAALGGCDVEPACEDNDDVRCASLKVQWRQWCGVGEEAEGGGTCDVK